MLAHKQNQYIVTLDSLTSATPQIVKIYHPGYPDMNAPFLSLPSYAPAPEQSTVVGLVHRVALDACYVLTNNQHGSLYGEDQLRIDPLVTPILVPGKYWYQLTGHEYTHQYLLVDSFSAWTPPDNLMDHWTSQSLGMDPRASGLDTAHYSTRMMSDRVKARDSSTCVLSQLQTQCGKVIENAHLVPRTEAAWFDRWTQFNHNSHVSPAIGVDDVSNGLTLRADLYGALDSFIFTPAVVSGKVVAYFLTWEPQLAQAYHNVPMTLSHLVSLQHIFSRFAYNIIQASQTKFRLFKKFKVPSDLLEQRELNMSNGKGRRSASKTPLEASIAEGKEPGETPPAGNPTFQEVRQMRFEKSYPHLCHEVEWSADPDWHRLGWHAEHEKMQELRVDYIAKHPSVSAVSDYAINTALVDWQSESDSDQDVDD